MPGAGRVLDLGCGANTDLAIYRTASREVWGADFEAHPELAHAECFRRLGPGGAIPFPDDYFDVVASVMVLEHVADPSFFLSEVARVLRPGGQFVGHTISGSHYVTWIRRLFGLLPFSISQRLVHRLYGRPEEDTFRTHYRLNRMDQITRHCEQAGLKVVRLQRYADPGYFHFSPVLRDAAVFTDWVFEQFAPGWGRLYFTVTLEKDVESTTTHIFPPKEVERKSA